jgi:hypothetical protein
MGGVVADHKDCFSIGNNHFWASKKNLSLLNSLLLSCEESGKSRLQKCNNCAY